MIFLFLLFQTCLACRTCITGPFNLEQHINSFNQLYIQADGIVVNNSTRIKYFDVPDSDTLCSIKVRNMTNTQSLKVMSSIVHRYDEKFKNFNAKWGFIIIYNGIGEQNCDKNTIYQITLVTDGKLNFLVANYILSKWNYSFNFEVGTNKFDTDHSSLIFNSNVNDSGRWVFQIENNSSTKLKIFYFSYILLQFVLFQINF